jgi:phosphotransferase system HPr (HPr) family protein
VPLAETSIVITNKVGLHARPARLLVQTAAQYQSQIQVLCGARAANAKSIVGILKLSA